MDFETPDTEKIVWLNNCELRETFGSIFTAGGTADGSKSSKFS